MKDPRIDPDTAERLLGGEPAGRPDLAGLLAAASADPPGGELTGEEAAVRAFRESRARRPPAAYARPAPAGRLLGSKTALAGTLIVVTGGVAVAATSSWRLPGPLGAPDDAARRTPGATSTVVGHPGVRSTNSGGPARSPAETPWGPGGRPIT